jgi:serine/threonine-protein kinase HipA
MARRPAHAPLSVYLNARLVGRLRRESSGAIDFQYDKDWLAWSSAIPVSVSLPLREDRYIGAPVLAVFENLLPDSDDIRRRVAERSHAAGSDAYSLLSAIGRDCVGALQFLPEGVAAGPAGAIDGRTVEDKEIATIVSDLARNPLGIGPDEEFRISLAGAQEKTALLYSKDKWHVPHGTTATTHIIKPQIGTLANGIELTNSVENEYFCLELVAALGVPVAKSRIIYFAGKRVLAIQRFDRTWTQDGRLLRLPQEDCCQALSVPRRANMNLKVVPVYARLRNSSKAATRRTPTTGLSSKRRSCFGCSAPPTAMPKISASGSRPAGDSISRRSTTSSRRSPVWTRITSRRTR